ncbi:unnamed protein product [Rhizophagus irregularis]|nr:unnamed protein product [Rhizophagus irregularis]
MSKRRYREINADIEEETTKFASTKEENLEEVESEDGLENQVEGRLPDNSNSGLSTLDENDRKGSFIIVTILNRGGKYDMSKGGSTGNLNRHLNKIHPEKINPSIAKQTEFMKKFIQSNEQIGSIIYINLFYFKIFHKNLAKWIAADDQPFTVVESSEFHHVIHYCNPMAFIPSADTMKTDILKLLFKA